MSAYPCRNENCKSYGKPHPNCRCYGNSGGEGYGDGYADGGEVESYCSSSRAHHAGCEYFAGGGMVKNPLPEFPQAICDHVSAHKGLLGMLNDVGHSKISNEDHHDKLKEATEHAKNGDSESMTESLSGHPLVGGIGKTRLSPIMSQMSGPVANSDVHPQSFRSGVDFYDSAKHGSDKISSKVSNILNAKSEKHEPDKDQREGLKKKLKEIAEDPKELFKIGGSLGHYLPAHAAQTAESAATALGYLKSIKPRPQQPGLMDSVLPASKMEENKYNRALDIANDPTLVIQHAKDGSITSDDMIALTAMYPNLSKSIMNKATEHLIENGTTHKDLKYSQKRALSVLLNQPVMFSQTQPAIAAIMQANAGAQNQPQASGPKNKKASGVELKQINMVNKNQATPLQERQIDRKA
jgi:hypothetical protein